MNQFISRGWTLALTLLSFAPPGLAQHSTRSLPALRKEYVHIARLNALSQSSRADLDSITFPIEKMNKAFYRALKLRAVYIDLPVDSFQLPNFPANSSEQTRAELDYLLDLQSKRTPEMIQAAQQIAGVSFNPFIHPSDSNYKYYRHNLFHIGHSMGQWFNETNLPKTGDLIANVWQDQLYYMWSLKFKFNRARPNALDARIKNLEQTMWPAYPSGHATYAYTNAFVLQELFPEHSDVLYNDAYECAHSREILGVHFPSDSEAARILARQLVNKMLQSDKFKRDLAVAKEEIDKFKSSKR